MLEVSRSAPGRRGAARGLPGKPAHAAGKSVSSGPWAATFALAGGVAPAHPLARLHPVVQSGRSAAGPARVGRGPHHRARRPLVGLRQAPGQALAQVGPVQDPPQARVVDLPQLIGLDAKVPRVAPVTGNPTDTQAVNGGHYAVNAWVLGLGGRYRWD